MKRVSVDRSRILQFQRCPRKRYLEYHEGGLGITGKSKPLPLAVGGAVHAGIEVLLREGQRCIWLTEGGLAEALRVLFDTPLGRKLEEDAVAAALADFASHASLEIDTTEAAAMGSPKSDEGEKIALALGLAPDHPQVVALRQQVGQNFNVFDKYLRAEQTALVEAMVRAYARRRLRPLLEQFEVLEVEREGTWQLATFNPKFVVDPVDDAEIVFMSRPAGIRGRQRANS